MTSTTFVFCVILCFIYIVHGDYSPSAGYVGLPKEKIRPNHHIDGTVYLNVTETLEECEKETKEKHCHLEYSEKNRRPHTLRWRYFASARNCELIYYANRCHVSKEFNNFESKEKCDSACTVTVRPECAQDPSDPYCYLTGNDASKKYTTRWRWSMAENRCVTIHYSVECTPKDFNNFAFQELCNFNCTGKRPTPWPPAIGRF